MGQVVMVPGAMIGRAAERLRSQISADTGNGIQLDHRSTAERRHAMLQQIALIEQLAARLREDGAVLSAKLAEADEISLATAGRETLHLYAERLEQMCQKFSSALTQLDQSTLPY